MFRILFTAAAAIVLAAVVHTPATLLCQATQIRAEASGAVPSEKPHMVFDVVSIRESREGNMSFYDNMPRTSYYHAERVAAWGLILHAYGVKLGNLLEGLPVWAWETRFNVTAKSDEATDEALARMSDEESYEEKQSMMRTVLAERFKLKIHSETRMATTYELVASKRNAELMTPVHGDVARTVSTCNQHYSTKGIEIDSKGCPFTILFSTLQQNLGTEVADHTGLSGMYAFRLMWSPPQMKVQEEERYPGMVDAAREQLGLEFKKTKGPVTFWVVDHIERPTPN